MDSVTFSAVERVAYVLPAVAGCVTVDGEP